MRLDPRFAFYCLSVCFSNLLSFRLSYLSKAVLLFRVFIYPSTTPVVCHFPLSFHCQSQIFLLIPSSFSFLSSHRFSVLLWWICLSAFSMHQLTPTRYASQSGRKERNTHSLQHTHTWIGFSLLHTLGHGFDNPTIASKGSVGSVHQRQMLHLSSGVPQGSIFRRSLNT